MSPSYESAISLTESTPHQKKSTPCKKSRPPHFFHKSSGGYSSGPPPCPVWWYVALVFVSLARRLRLELAGLARFFSPSSSQATRTVFLFFFCFFRIGPACGSRRLGLEAVGFFFFGGCRFVFRGVSQNTGSLVLINPRLLLDLTPEEWWQNLCFHW